MSEVEFCDRLRAWAEGFGFEVYPEVDGWDLVLVAVEGRPLQEHALTFNVKPGEQLGIHAKLRANCDVLVQALPYEHGGRYPHYPFVAAPIAGAAFRTIARRLGVGVISTDEPGPKTFMGHRLPGDGQPRVREWPRHRGLDGVDRKPLALPPVASRAIVAGAPSPRVLSPWRVKALRFLAFARARGTFTVSDLKTFELGKSWADSWGSAVGWAHEVRRGKTVRVRTYRLTDSAERLPDWGYKDVAAELAAAGGAA